MKATDKSERFLGVIQTHKGILYKIANAYCHDAEDRKDLVQEIIIQLWKSFDNYSDEFKYSTWIYRIALNVAISFYRKENRRKQVDSPLSDGVLNMTDTGLPDDTVTNYGSVTTFPPALNYYNTRSTLPGLHHSLHSAYYYGYRLLMPRYRLQWLPTRLFHSS